MSIVTDAVATCFFDTTVFLSIKGIVGGLKRFSLLSDFYHASWLVAKRQVARSDQRVETCVVTKFVDRSRCLLILTADEERKTSLFRGTWVNM